MSPSILFFAALTYVNGIVAGIQNSPVYWSEVVCRAKMEGRDLKGPEDPQASTFIKKRVYDRLIVDYHKLGHTKKPTELCALVKMDAKLTLDWVKTQQKVWKEKSEASLKQLLEQLEQQYDVSWR